MVFTEIIVVGGIATVIGITIGYFLTKSKKFTKLISRDDKNLEKILNDPELLVKRLNENQYIDEGQKLIYEVREIDGKKIVVHKKTNINPPVSS